MQPTSKRKSRLSLPSSLLIFSLLAVVLTSGCIGQEFFPGIPGVISPSRSTVDQGITNLVTIENVRTIPVGQVLPDTGLKLFLSAVSKDTDPTREIKNVIVDLFDASVFRSPAENKPFCNAARDNCLPNLCSYNSPCTLRAGETKAIEWSLLAPTREQIANIQTQASLNFRVNYDFTGSTNYDILVVDYNELLRLQQEGKTMSVSVQDTKGAGPVKIDVSLFTPYVVTSQAADQRGDAFVVFRLRNVGQGSLKENKITKMEIDFPKEIFSANFLDEDKDRRFTCSDTQVDGLIVVRCSSTGNAIELFRKESDPIQFIIRKVPPITVPHKTYTINARVEYTYELRGSAQVTVSPPQR